MAALVALCHAGELYERPQAQFGYDVSRYVDGGIRRSPVIVCCADETEALGGDFQQPGDAFRLAYGDEGSSLSLLLVVMVLLIFVFLGFITVAGFAASLSATLTFGLGVFVLFPLRAWLAVEMAALVALLPLAVLVFLWGAHILRTQKS